MSLEIRKFKESDLDEVLILCNEVREHHREVLNGYFTEQNDDLEKMPFLDSLKNDIFMAWVACEEEKIEGLLLAEKRNSPFLEEPKVGYIHNFGVSKNCRNKGIGKLLMNRFYEECKICGIQEIKLGVFNANKVAYDFYQNYGFKLQEQKMSLRIK